MHVPKASPPSFGRRVSGSTNDPSGFPIAEEFGASGVRKRVHGRYLILYRVHRSEVEVLRVVHGARDRASLPGEAEQ